MREGREAKGPSVRLVHEWEHEPGAGIIFTEHNSTPMSVPLRSP
jgi:hypothetical protein